MNCDFGTAAMALLALFLSAKAFLSTLGPAKVEATADDHFSENRHKLLAMKHLRIKSGFSNQG
jgi:hypothetical protein